MTMWLALAPHAVSQDLSYGFQWKINETPQGQESATVVEPLQVTLLGAQVEIASHNAALWLMKRYSVHLGAEWSAAQAYKLLHTFESIPQERNYSYAQSPSAPNSLWKLSGAHVPNDIEINVQGGVKVVTVAAEAFGYANPFLAEIEGVRGKLFSKRLHRAVTRFVTDNGADRNAIKRILRERYSVSIDVPDYVELTRYTTREDAARFSEFKNEELIAIVAMFEEFPQGMLKTPGLNYLVRRLDGTQNPKRPLAPAIAYTQSGYIEFMESAFKEKGLDYIHRLILHEKAHFLWAHLFDNHLKQDWIELGGWYENPDDADGWSTTKQTEFVSAYAHGKNPNEDMAESISFYIVRPDKLRSRSPAKYEFIQNRIMHGARYISKIRGDLTFQVYNLYPDYVYPGRIVRVNIQVLGEPKADKRIIVEIEIHGESDLDAAHKGYTRIFSSKGTFFDLHLYPIRPDGSSLRGGSSHILRGEKILSRYAPNGYWGPDAIKISDIHGNERYSGQTDFGWKLYVDNPLADFEAPAYVPNSMRLSLSGEGTENGRAYQIVTAKWRLIEENGVKRITAAMYDLNRETYSRTTEDGTYNPDTGEAAVKFMIPDYWQNGTYTLVSITMTDLALNKGRVYFTDSYRDEKPATIEIQTTNPDSVLPTLDLNQISIKAAPTNPAEPNGETRVEITYRVKDNISGFARAELFLRDPQGVMHKFRHYHDSFWDLYFPGDPTAYQTYQKAILLPVGSAPGTWGLAKMNVMDKALNTFRADFTEIVRFEVGDEGDALTGLKTTFTIALKRGLNLIHVPVKDVRLSKVSDLYNALGGSSDVEYIVAHIPSAAGGGSFAAYVGIPGSLSDIALSDQTAAIVSMRTAKNVSFTGGLLNDTVTLKEGVNLIGVPRAEAVEKASAIAPNAVAVLALTRDSLGNALFSLVVPNTPSDVAPVGGQGYIVVAGAPATIAYTGEAWAAPDNSAPAAAASTDAVKFDPTSAPVLLVEGLFAREDTLEPVNGLQVTIRNLRTGESVVDTAGLTAGGGQFVIPMIALRGGHYEEGDTLEASAVDPSGTFGGWTPVRAVVGKDEIAAGRIDIGRQLLSAVPSKTALLPNYPNPFNPETWIPFELAESSRVKITIYNAAGQTVRVLELGQLPAGSYRSRSKAAHWDGRNALGEPAASGIYYARIEAGSFTALRRMVVLK